MVLRSGDRPVIFSVGHSTRGIDAFVEMLRVHGVRAVADVRQHPRSRRHPQFNDDALAGSLGEAGVAYVSLRSLGGRRRPLPRERSVNTGWENESFRGYADFMQTAAFESGLEALMDAAQREPTAMMCAEAVHWRCHRRLIADALLARGWRVLHIQSASPSAGLREHALPPFAEVEGERVRYPGEVGGAGDGQGGFGWE